LKNFFRPTHSLLNSLLKFGDCKFIRTLGLNGSKYNQKVNLESSPSKYSMLARPVLQAISRQNLEKNDQMIFQGDFEKKLKILSIQFLTNFWQNKKNDELNLKTLKSFKNCIGR